LVQSIELDFDREELIYFVGNWFWTDRKERFIIGWGKSNIGFKGTYGVADGWIMDFF